jgi:pectin methylesterase-like acyl-CoA thioesterase
MKLSLLLAAFLAWCAPALSANTWIVDVNNGPGTHFTSLNAAVAAVSPNDTLLILPGTYSRTLCNKPLRMVGVGTSPLNPVWVSTLLLFDLPTNSTTSIANMRFFGPSVCLTAQNCQGSILVDGVTCTGVTVTNCADVRFRALETYVSCFSTNSRVERAVPAPAAISR